MDPPHMHDQKIHPDMMSPGKRAIVLMMSGRIIISGIIIISIIVIIIRSPREAD